MTGRIFEIREFTLQDGPGIRTTVFFKGCPLRCAWCHNPEGQSFDRETMTMRDGTKRVVGEDWSAEELARELLKNADIMSQSGGGITFSGGEPLAQPEFLEELVETLVTHHSSLTTPHSTLHLALETSGYVDSAIYRRIVSKMDFVYQDLKHHDAAAFRKWTGGDLGVVLGNIAWLKTSDVPYCIRVPIIPGVNDSATDRDAIAVLVGESPVEYLPYNPAAGAKYPLLGRQFDLNMRLQ